MLMLYGPCHKNQHTCVWILGCYCNISVICLYISMQAKMCKDIKIKVQIAGLLLAPAKVFGLLSSPFLEFLDFKKSLVFSSNPDFFLSIFIQIICSLFQHKS